MHDFTKLLLKPGFERALEWGSPRASDTTKYWNSQQLLAPNHLRYGYGVDSESLARKKKGTLESQVCRYDPIKLVESRRSYDRPTDRPNVQYRSLSILVTPQHHSGLAFRDRLGDDKWTCFCVCSSARSYPISSISKIQIVCTPSSKTLNTERGPGRTRENANRVYSIMIVVLHEYWSKTLTEIAP